MKKVLVMLMLAPVALFAVGIQAAGRPNRSPECRCRAMMNCPMNLQGTTVAVADTATGITVSITTKPENVAELAETRRADGSDAQRPALQCRHDARPDDAGNCEV